MTVSNETKPILDKAVKTLKFRQEGFSYRLMQSVRTFILFAVGRTFTVAGSLAGCIALWRQLFSETRLWTLFDGSLYTYGLDQKDFYVALAGILVIILVDLRHERGKQIRMSIDRQPIILRWAVYYTAIFSIIILGMYGPGFDAASFVYGAF